MRAYQDEDRHLVDYGLAVVPGLEDWGKTFRGPHPSGEGFLAFLGAAQTFGRLVEDPFPSLVSSALGLPALNLGHGGAGPEFYLRTNLLDAIRDASVVVVQVMSARSQTSPDFLSDEGLIAGRRRVDGRPMVAEELFEDVLRHEPDRLAEVVKGFQDAYVRSMLDLARRVGPERTVLLWFSTIQPPLKAGEGRTALEVLGVFPQLVTQEMVETIRPAFGRYVEYASSIGLPRQIRSSDGSPASFVLDYRVAHPRTYTVSTDNYYPSPEMHAGVAEVVSLCISQML